MAVFRYRNKPFVLLALFALVVAQAAAGLHALQHFGKQGDPLGVPSQHAQLCLECASFAPVGVMHGGSVTALSVATVTAEPLLDLVARIPAARTSPLPFRSRAPPAR